MVASDPPPATEIAQRLVTMRTVNPPGDEAAAQRYLSSLIESAGIDVDIRERTLGRPNLIARLPGRGERPPVVLHGHVDVVGVDGQQWHDDPFAGTVRDGVLHGRGTLDMKSGVAMLTHAFLQTAVDGVVPAGDIVLVAAVDSESGGADGMAFLLDQHPAIFDGARYAIGEFGGFPLYAFGRTFYRIGVAQKRYAHLRVHLRGRGGHGSRPATGTVVGALGRTLARIDDATLPYRQTAVAVRVIGAIADAVAPDDAQRLRRLLDPAQFDEAVAGLGPHRATFEALFRDTANPTIITAGHKFNVIPSDATIEVDARLLPGRTVDALIADLRGVIDEDAIVEVVDAGPPSPLDFDAGLLDLLGSILTELDPRAIPVPYLFNESPDGRLFAAHGIQHYGFLPMNLPPEIDLTDLIHGPDERVPLAAIEFGARALRQLIARY